MEDSILDHFGEFDENIRIVVARYFHFESEAYLYAARLKEADIACFISNSNMGTALPLGAGTISLHVKENDLLLASQIIQDLDQQKTGEKGADTFRDADLGEIKYQQKLHQSKQKPDWVVLSLIIVIVLIVVRAYLRASGWAASWWDTF